MPPVMKRVPESPFISRCDPRKDHRPLKAHGSAVGFFFRQKNELLRRHLLEGRN